MKPGHDSPDLIRPMPTNTLVANLRAGAQACTVIARTWAPGDAARCRLCSECSASADGLACLVIAGRHVPDADAPTFGIR